MTCRKPWATSRPILLQSNVLSLIVTKSVFVLSNVFKNNLNFQIHFNCSLYIEYNSVSEIHSQLPTYMFFMLNESIAVIDGRSGEKEVSTHPPPLPKNSNSLNLHYKIINNVDCTPLSKLRYPSYLLKKPKISKCEFQLLGLTYRNQTSPV